MKRRDFLASLGGSALLPAALHARGPREPSLSLDNFAVVVRDLDHPEGIAAGAGNALVFSDLQAAVSVRTPDNKIVRFGEAISPCGVAVDPQGNAVVANMGLLSGKPGILQRVDLTTGETRTLVASLEERPLVASNNPVVASDGTIYCTHSSWGEVALIGKKRADGFIYAVLPSGEARIVARNIRNANGTCFDKDEKYLFVCSTAEGRVYRYRRLKGGMLGPQEAYGPKLGVTVDDQSITTIRSLPTKDRAQLGYCDGIIFDRYGNLLVTLPFADKIVAITPDRQLRLVHHDKTGTFLNMPTNMAWDEKEPDTLYTVSRATNMIVKATARRV